MIGLLVLLGILFVVSKQLTLRLETVREPTAPLGPHATFLETSLGRVHILDSGIGDALLLLHGSGASIADWQEGLADRLSQHHRVIAFDNFGFGMSDRDHPYRYGNALFADQAVAVLDALNIEKVVVMGHSAGGVVAAILAADHSERVRGVVFSGHGIAMDPVQILPFVPGVGELQLSLTPIGAETFSPIHKERMTRAYEIRGTRAAFLTFVRRQYTIDGLRLLSGTYEEITVPVLQLHGTQDRSIAISAAQALSSRIAKSQFVPIEEAGHFTFIDAPEKVAKHVADFVASLSD